jgi:arginyl-tRNA synthetase
VKLKELLDEAIRTAENDMLSRIQSEDSSINELTQQQKNICEVVGIASVKYADLSMNRLSDYRFSFKKMLSLTGNTAPYMLYAYVRIRGIQRKASSSLDMTNLSSINISLDQPEEISLAKHLLRLEEILQEVSQDLFPNKVKTDCGFSFDFLICHSFPYTDPYFISFANICLNCHKSSTLSMRNALF